MLQHTYDRLDGLVPAERVLVLTNGRYVDLVREQLPELPAANVIGEPVARDTSAAVALAAALCAGRFGDPVMSVLTADHLIQPVDLFQRTLVSAAAAARDSGALYTFGIAPDFPSTGYGYLEAGDALETGDDVEHFRLNAFREKPDIETAKVFLTSGRHSWNSGMFAWRTSAIAEAIRRFLPDHAARIGPLAEADGTASWEDDLRAAFEPLPKISIDFGVMEKADDVRMVRASFQWSDVGGWLALEQFHDPDGANNRGTGRIRPLKAVSNSVFCEDTGETVALVGVSDLVVVRSGDRTLVAHRDAVEQIKQLVEQMKADGELADGELE
jgi:mannose-1-phosphate guanylyltransferase